MLCYLAQLETSDITIGMRDMTQKTATDQSLENMTKTSFIQFYLFFYVVVIVIMIIALVVCVYIPQSSINSIKKN